MPPREIRIWGLETIPEVQPGDDIAELILNALPHNGRKIPDGTVFVVAQKIVSKAEGQLLDLDMVTPSAQARHWAEKHDKDARVVEAVLRQAKRVVRMDRGVLIVETQHGFICANGGVDTSNTPRGTVTLLPEDSDQSASRLRSKLETALELQIAVIISDTFGRPWRQGLTNVALGASGLPSLVDYRGQTDSHGRTLDATVLAVADELASAAELAMGKTLRIPVALIEGFRYHTRVGKGRDLLRPAEEDLFR